MVGMIYIAYGLISFIRIIIDLNIDPGNDFLKSGLYDTLVILSYQMLFISLTFNLFLMVNRGLMVTMEDDINKRIKIESDLRKSEEKFAIAFHNIPDALVISTLKDGKVIEVNAVFYEIQGFTQEDILDKTTIQLNLWENLSDRDRYVNELKKNGKATNLIMNFRKKSGEIFTGLISGEIIQLNGEECVLSIIRDETERIQTRQEIERIASFPQLNPNPVLEVDSNGKITFFNQATCDYLDSMKLADPVNLLPEDLDRIIQDAILGLSNKQNREVVIGDRVFSELIQYVPKFKTLRVFVTEITELKETEVSLRETSNYLNKLIGYANAPIITWNSATEITRFNHAFEHLTGFSAEEVIGKKLQILFPKSAKKLILEKIKQTLNGEFWESVEIPINCKGGESRLVLWNSANVYDEDGTTLLATIAHGMDITERQFHVKEIEKQNRELNFLFQASPQLGRSLDLPEIYSAFYQQISMIMPCDILYIADYDPISKMLTARYAVNNSKSIDVTGFPKISIGPEGKGIKCLTIQTGDTRRISDYKSGGKKTGTNYLIGFVNQLISGNEMISNGRTTRSALVIPIKYNNLVKGIIQIQSYKVNAYSDDDLRFAETIGFQTAIAVNNAHLYQSSLIEIALRQKAEEKVQADQEELRRLLDASDRSGKALLSVIEDQMEAKEKLRQLNQDLEERVRQRTALLTAANQELEAFSYSVSHDLRAPLRALDGFSSALLDDNGEQLDDQGKHFLNRIMEASQRMGNLINDLLNLSRITRVEFSRQEVDLSLISQNIVKELNSTNPEKQAKVELSDNMLVNGDASLLRIALENLINNAFKFSSKCEQPVIRIGEMEQSGERVFFVRDNGVGFNMDYADKLFIPFQRLHSMQEYPGTGIGLVTVKRIITRHGGRLWPESEVGVGTTFYFTLGGVK
jgi:PAS domain S-box-containing protein